MVMDTDMDTDMVINKVKVICFTPHNFLLV